MAMSNQSWWRDRMIWAVVILGAAAAFTVLYSWSRLDAAFDEDVTLVRLGGAVERLASRATLELERAHRGDPGADLQRNAMSSLDAALGLVDAALVGGDTVLQAKLRPVADVETRQELSALRRELVELRNISQERQAQPAAGGDLRSSHAEQVFARIRASTQRLGEQLREVVNSHQQRMASVQVVVALVLLSLSLAIAMLVRKQRKVAESRSNELEQRVQERTVQLADSEAKTRAVIATLVDGLLIVDDRGIIEAFNPAAEGLFACPAVQALGRPIQDLLPSVAANLGHLRAGVGAESKRDARGGEGLGRSLDGREFPVEVASSEMTSGGRRMLVVVVRDISERKVVESAMEAARNSAEAATRSKSVFLANMSHEIRTPMNAVIGMTGLLLETRMAPEQRDFVETIRLSGDSLLTIIDDILDYSKIESGRMQLERVPLDVRDCVEEAVDLLAARAGEKGLDLCVVIEENVPRAIYGDLTRVRQVLVNLVSNAVKFTAAGEVRVMVSVETVGDGLAHLRFSVRDTGAGIPAEAVERLFQSFSQVDASTTRRFGGTGLGLAICKGLVELLGGKIGVASEAGAGALFWFTLPAEVAPAEARPYRSGSVPALAQKRVLIVADDETSRSVLIAHLHAWGMLATAVASAEAVPMHQGPTFDVALVDLQLADGGGVQVARGLQEMAGRRLPIVLMTKRGQRPWVDDVRFAGYVTRPIKPSQLFDVLSTVFDAGPAQRRLLSMALPTAERLATRLPLRILLAEDNAVNQKVALRVLERMGFRAEVAGNGVEVLQLLAQRPYDVVLMDVQMPEMDGLEATRQVRLRYPNGVPRIIAMTANASIEDREACLAAGMDDYLSKPVRAEQLHAVLERWGTLAQATSDPALAAAASERARADAIVVPLGDGKASDAACLDPNVPVLDPEPIASLQTLQQPGEADFAWEIVQLYLQETPARIEAIVQSSRNGNREPVSFAAHALKGSSYNLGAQRVGGLCALIEQAANDGDLTRAVVLADALTAEFQRARDAMTEACQVARGIAN